MTDAGRFVTGVTPLTWPPPSHHLTQVSQFLTHFWTCGYAALSSQDDPPS
jgi:hypothetical protein